MGTCISKDKNEHAKYGFSAEEFEQIETIYQSISEQKFRTAFRKTIGKKGLQGEFPENSDLALKIYNWMAKCNEPDPITFESYLHCIQLLTHKTSEFKIASYANRSYEPIETTALISIEKYLKEKEPVPKSVITYAQGLKLIKTKPTVESNDLPAKVLAHGIFTGANSTERDFNSFLADIKHQLEHINHYLRVYYYSRFIDRGMQKLLKVPFLESSSLILTDELLSLFSLTCEHFQRADELSLLYSDTEYMGSFDDLVTALEGYEAPTLILVKHVQKESGVSKYPVHVFGGFASMPWKNRAEYHGDCGSFVFSLIPKFRKYYPTLKGQNFQYLNGQNAHNKKFVKGLAFGGANDESCRLWIGDSMSVGTSTSPEDQTYEKGPLIDPLIQALNIEEIEVWGLGGLAAKTKQEIYRALHKIIPKAPKRKTHVFNKRAGVTITQESSKTPKLSRSASTKPDIVEKNPATTTTNAPQQLEKKNSDSRQDIGYLPVLGHEQDGINAD